MTISLIIAGYEPDTELLEKAVCSVRASAPVSVEILYVDDGSSREKLEAVKEVLNKASLQDGVGLRIIEAPHGGVSKARNMGMKESGGDYIMFLDDDDMLYSWAIDDAYSLITREKADVVIGAESRDAQYIQEEEYKEKIYSDDEIKTFLPSMFNAYKVLSHKNCFVGRGPVARLVKRELALSTTFDETLPYREDVLWNLQLLLKCRKIVVVNKAWYYYYLNPSSVMQSFRPDIAGILENAAGKIEAVLKNNGLDLGKDYCDYLFQELIMIYRLYLGQEKDRRARKEVEKKLYGSRPWNEITEHSYVRQAGMKGRIISALYKGHMLFAVFDIEKKVLGRV